MKRTIYLLMLVLVLGFASCNQSPKQPVNPQKPIPANSELAVFDNGQLSFYDVKSHEFITFEQETDSVVNGVFTEDGKFYYCVVKGDQILLKYVDLNEGLTPVLAANMGLEPNRCITETYGDFASLEYFEHKGWIGLEHEFSWDGFGFTETRLYDMKTGKVRDLDWDVDNPWDYDEYEEGEEDEDEWDEAGFEAIDGQAYCLKDGEKICLSDKMNVAQYASDPDYMTSPDFYYFEVNPQGDMVRFAASIESGDFEHGPWCVASIDGKFQMALEGTDFCDGAAKWLSNGSLVFVGTEPRPESDPDYDAEWYNTMPCIKIMNPNHEITVLSHASKFVKR